MKVIKESQEGVKVQEALTTQEFVPQAENVLTKLAKARQFITNTPVKKAGRNSYSEYDYFTPAQISSLVEDACNKYGLLTVYNLKRDEFGLLAKLDVIDTANGATLSFQIVTDIPEIKATNSAQKLGGVVTYSERYLKMTAFGIVDNNLDFDTTTNTKKAATPKSAPEKKVLTKEAADAMIGFIADGKGEIVASKLAFYAPGAEVDRVITQLK